MSFPISGVSSGFEDADEGDVVEIHGPFERSGRPGTFRARERLMPALDGALGNGAAPMGLHCALELVRLGANHGRADEFDVLDGLTERGARSGAEEGQVGYRRAFCWCAVLRPSANLASP